MRYKAGTTQIMSCKHTGVLIKKRPCLTLVAQRQVTTNLHPPAAVVHWAKLFGMVAYRVGASMTPEGRR